MILLLLIILAICALIFYYYTVTQKKRDSAPLERKQQNNSFQNKQGKDSLEIDKIRQKINLLEKEEYSLFEKITFKLAETYPNTPIINIPIYRFIGFIVSSFCFFYFIELTIINSILASFLSVIVITLIIIKRETNKRTALFLDYFTDALDVIARGVKSGFMLHDCFSLIVKDGHPIISEKFTPIVRDLQIGLPISEVMNRFSKKTPLKEVRFFAIIIIIQTKTGGNLAEIIMNLSNVLRQRKEILRKISILSQEAKSAAIIMMSFPFAITGLFSVMAPDFVAPLFYTDTGHYIMMGCVFWVFLGAMIMRSMINFYK